MLAPATAPCSCPEALMMKDRCSSCSGLVLFAHYWTSWGWQGTPPGLLPGLPLRASWGMKLRGLCRARTHRLRAPQGRWLWLVCHFPDSEPTLASSAHDACTSPQPLSSSPDGPRWQGPKGFLHCSFSPILALSYLPFPISAFWPQEWGKC